MSDCADWGPPDEEAPPTPPPTGASPPTKYIGKLEEAKTEQEYEASQSGRKSVEPPPPSASTKSAIVSFLTLCLSVPALIGAWCWPSLLAAAFTGGVGAVSDKIDNAAHVGTLALNVNMMAAMYFFFIGTLRVRRWKYKDPLIIYGPMLLLTVATPLMCLQPFCKVLKDHTLRVMDIPAEIFLLISIFGIMFARMLIKKKPWGPFEVRHAPWGLLWVSIGFMLFSVLCIVLVYLDIAQQRMGPILMQTQLVCGMKVTSIGKVGSLGYSSTVLKVLSWVGIIVFAVAAMWNVDIWEKLKKIKNKWAELQEERRRAQVAQTQYESTGLLVDNSRA